MTAGAQLQLTEVLAALSLATDLANGHAMERALRATLLATGLARAHGLAPAVVADVYLAGLIRFIGCTAHAHEEARAFGGDDIEFRRAFAAVDPRAPGELLAYTFGALARDAGPVRRAGAVARMLTRPERLLTALARSQCEVGQRLATRLRMPAGVVLALGQLHARWDGGGAPAGLGGADISPVARVLHLAGVAELVHRQSGRAAACALVQARSGGQLEPELARSFIAASAALCAALERPSVWDEALAAAPVGLAAPPVDLDEVARAFADFVDLGSAYTPGHSSAVADLAERAGGLAGLSPAVCVDLRRAGLLHDIGHASVPAGVWEQPAALSSADWDRVRLHPYYTERVLSRSPVLAPLAALASAHHERGDGSGYFRQLPAAALGLPAQILAAADCYQAMTELRPHRAAHSAGAAAKLLADEAAAGRLAVAAVEVVLQAAGHRQRRIRRAWPASLSEREVEVLRALARGHTNKQIGQALGISARTVQHHVLHIYGKIGASSRAGAALFAVEHELVQAEHGA